MLHVGWSFIWNVTQYQLGEPAAMTVTGCSELPAFFIVP